MDSDESGSYRSRGSIGFFQEIESSDESFSSARESDVEDVVKKNIDIMVHQTDGTKKSILQLLPAASLKTAPPDLLNSVYYQLRLILRNHGNPTSKTRKTMRSAMFYSVLQLITERVKLDWNLREANELSIDGETKVKLVNFKGKNLGGKADYSIEKFRAATDNVSSPRTKILLFFELGRYEASEGVKQALLYLKYLSQRDPERMVCILTYFNFFLIES